MSEPFSQRDAAFVGVVLGHLFLGAYITVFGLYVQMTRHRKAKLVAIDYGVIALFILTVVYIALDTQRGPELLAWTGGVNSTTSTLSMTLDFLSQAILIYRCWAVWGHSLWVAIVPGFLALASWVCGLVVTIDLATYNDSFAQARPVWWMPLGTTAMTLSLAVNAVVSCLMISRIWFVYSETKASGNQTGTRLSWVAAVLLESAIALFIAQLVYLVTYALRHVAFSLVADPVTIVYGLNATAIMVRVGMNRSYETRTTAYSTTGTISFAARAPATKVTQETYMSGSTSNLDMSRDDKKEKNSLNYGDTQTTLAGDRRV